MRVTRSRKPAARGPQAGGGVDGEGSVGREVRRPGPARQAKSAGTRAPRGANREAVLAVVGERPGVIAREVAAASGVTGGTLYSLLARLTARGELAKRDLPGGQTGYARADSAAPATVAAGR